MPIQALHACGVPTVIMALWAVPDEAGNNIMTKFYEMLAASGGDGDAPHLMRMAILRTFDSPAALRSRWMDWAPLQVHGAAQVQMPPPPAAEKKLRMLCVHTDESRDFAESMLRALAAQVTVVPAPGAAGEEEVEEVENMEDLLEQVHDKYLFDEDAVPAREDVEGTALWLCLFGVERSEEDESVDMLAEAMLRFEPTLIMLSGHAADMAGIFETRAPGTRVVCLEESAEALAAVLAKEAVDDQSIALSLSAECGSTAAADAPAWAAGLIFVVQIYTREGNLD